MGDQENRQVIENLFEALQKQDVDQLRAILDEHMADDYVQEWPQSGERIRGKANALAIGENYPGLPSAKLREIKGSGDLWVGEVTLDYGQGPVHGVSVFEFRDGKIFKQADYFADPFEAPEWRAQWVEKM